MPVTLTKEQLALPLGDAISELTDEEFEVYDRARFGEPEPPEEQHRNQYFWGDTTDAWEAFGRTRIAPATPAADPPATITPPANAAPAVVAPAAKPPRKRGRPAKVIAEPEPTPRKRGRPAKVKA